MQCALCARLLCARALASGADAIEQLRRHSGRLFEIEPDAAGIGHAGYNCGAMTRCVGEASDEALGPRGRSPHRSKFRLAPQERTRGRTQSAECGPGAAPPGRESRTCFRGRARDQCSLFGEKIVGPRRPRCLRRHDAAGGIQITVESTHDPI